MCSSVYRIASLYEQEHIKFLSCMLEGPRRLLVGYATLQTRESIGSGGAGQLAAAVTCVAPTRQLKRFPSPYLAIHKAVVLILSSAQALGNALRTRASVSCGNV